MLLRSVVEPVLKVACFVCEVLEHSVPQCVIIVRGATLEFWVAATPSLVYSKWPWTMDHGLARVDYHRRYSDCRLISHLGSVRPKSDPWQISNYILTDERTWSISNNGSLSHRSTTLPECSSWPWPTKLPDHSTLSLIDSKTRDMK